MTEFPDPEIHRKIYYLILKNPGVQLRNIAEMLNASSSLVEPYVCSLEEKKEIYCLSEDGCSRYYVRKKSKGTRERKTQEIRQRILDILYSHPGLHLSKIAESLEMSVELAKYHLQHMEKNGLITGVRGEKKYYKRFYVKDSEIGVKDKKIVAFLRQEQILKIVAFILKNPNIQHKQLSDLLDIHPSTLTYHIIRLYEFGVIEIYTYGNKKGYVIKDKKEIIRVIKSYITESKVEHFKDLWDKLKLR